MTSSIFFFHDTAPTEIYTLSLHDALPISNRWAGGSGAMRCIAVSGRWRTLLAEPTRPSVPPMCCGLLRSEEHTSELQHSQISYAVFCLKKKKINTPDEAVSTVQHEHLIIQ